MEQKRAGCLTIIIGAVLLGAVLDRCSSKPKSEPIPAVTALETPAVSNTAERFTTYSIGQLIWLGDWSYKVVDAKWLPLTPLRDMLGPGIQSPYRRETPDSLYLVLDVIVRNNGNSEENNKASSVSSFEVIDGIAELSKGRLNLPGRGEPEVQRYGQSLRQYPGYPTFPEFMTLLNPGMATRGSIIFDVPQDRSYALYLEYRSGQAVLIPLPAPSVPPVLSPSQAVEQSSDTPKNAPELSTETSAPAPPVEVSKPTSGVLCSGAVAIPQSEELTFKNLPGERLKFTFDHDAWFPSIRRQPDGTQTLIMRSIKPGIQTKCDMRWEIAP